MRATLRWSLTALALLAVWVVAYALGVGGIQEARAQRELYARLRQSLAAATAPLGGVIRPGTPVALVDAPGAGLHRTVVVEGTAPGQLVAGPGHRSDTPLPGQPGVAVLFGRSVTYGAPFGRITRLRAGTPITVTTGQGVFRYVVERVRHAGDPLPPPLTKGGGRLVLVTATGARFAPDRAVYVDALLTGRAQPAPPGRPAYVPLAAQAMHGDAAVAIELVLWLQALVVAGVALVWAHTRWGTWQTWLVGLPVVLAVLAAATQPALRLMPNLV